MAKNNFYRHCELSRGTSRRVAYIDERDAKVGAQTELINGDMWTVDAVLDDERLSLFQLLRLVPRALNAK